MTDYLDFNDLKTVIIGVVSGVLTWFICLGISRYWSNHSIKSLNRRIQEAEAQKLLVEDLAKSERAVLLMGFRVLFGLLALICLVVMIHIVLMVPLRRYFPVHELTPVFLFLWGVVALLALYFADLVKKVGEYPKSLETFETKIERLRSKLRRRSGRQE
jgi:uncharacterized membrane protein YqjE